MKARVVTNALTDSSVTRHLPTATSRQLVATYFRSLWLGNVKSAAQMPVCLPRPERTRRGGVVGVRPMVGRWGWCALWGRGKPEGALRTMVSGGDHMVLSLMVTRAVEEGRSHRLAKLGADVLEGDRIARGRRSAGAA